MNGLIAAVEAAFRELYNKIQTCYLPEEVVLPTLVSGTRAGWETAAADAHFRLALSVPLNLAKTMLGTLAIKQGLPWRQRSTAKG